LVYSDKYTYQLERIGLYIYEMSPPPPKKKVSIFEKYAFLSVFEINASSDKKCYVSLHHENTVVAGG
jgi:hypothetical protein